jgi:hypothetical protein
MQEGYTKADGTFFTSPTYAYKFKRTLNPNYYYRLIVKNTQTGEIDSAQTSVLNNDPSVFYAYELKTSGFTVSFTSPKPGQQAVFSLLVRLPDNPKTSAPPSYTQTLDGVIRFHWTDKNTGTGAETKQYADWTFASNSGLNSTTTTLSVGGSSFFSFLSGAMGPAPAGIERHMGTCDISLWGGDTTIHNYQLYTLSAFGLTADQIKPIYTNFKSNVSGTYPVGILGSRALNLTTGIPIDPASIDSLKINPATSNLNIKD